MGVEKMYNVLFSVSKVDEINAKVSCNIAPHLFVFCNYNPDSVSVISYDAKFILSVMNLYKLLVDASICSQLFNIARENCVRYDNRLIKNIQDTVQALRTVIGHNIDDKNGNDEEKKTVEKWFRTLINKIAPETEADYKRVLDEIEKYGDDLCDVLESIINQLSNSNAKRVIIDSWERAIISFYQRPNSLKIIEGQLFLAYQARKYVVSQKIQKREIACWVQKKIFSPEEDENENLKSILGKKGIDASSREKIMARINENELSLEEKKKKVAKESKKNIDSLGVFDYLKFYEKQMAILIEEKIKNNSVDSLLPQNIIQEIIEVEFENL